MFLHVRISYYLWPTTQRIQSIKKHQLLSPIRQWSVILMLFGNLFARRKMKNGNCCASVFRSKIMTIIILRTIMLVIIIMKSIYSVYLLTLRASRRGQTQGIYNHANLCDNVTSRGLESQKREAWQNRAKEVCFNA